MSYWKVIDQKGYFWLKISHTNLILQFRPTSLYFQQSRSLSGITTAP